MTKQNARNGQTIYLKIEMQTIVFLRGASSLVISVQQRLAHQFSLEVQSLEN